MILIDGKEFGDYTMITAHGITTDGHKQVLGFWPGARENAVVCGALLDGLIQRGLAVKKSYLFVLEESRPSDGLAGAAFV